MLYKFPFPPLLEELRCFTIPQSSRLYPDGRVRPAPELFVGIDWSNMVIAGGSAAAMIFGSYMASDIDIFLYGFKETKEYNAKVKYIVEFITSRLPDANVLQSDYTIKITSRDVKIDIILIVHATMEDIIDGFDIDAAKFMFNGTDILTNYDGLKCYHTGSFPIRYDRLSGAYFGRVEKYIRRGFALQVPELQGLEVDLALHPRIETDEFYIICTRYGAIQIGWKTRKNERSSSNTSHNNVCKLMKCVESGLITPIQISREFVFRKFNEYKRFAVTDLKEEQEKLEQIYNRLNERPAAGICNLNWRVVTGQGSQFNPIPMTKEQLWRNIKVEYPCGNKNNGFTSYKVSEAECED